MIENQEKLKELRYDMANNFAEYLKPAKNERQAEKYTQTERKTEGFDLSYIEPSPYGAMRTFVHWVIWAKN
jgi:hypothetical protein